MANKKPRVRNGFTGGLNKDLNLYAIKSNQLSHSLNNELTTASNNEYILQSARSNSNNPDWDIPEGFVVLGSKEYNGINYLVIFNPLTQEGEVGTFPSPEYTITDDEYDLTGNIVKQYGSLKNYSGDTPYYLPDYQDFRSTLFNFSFENDTIQIEIQPDYDDTVNIIFSDNENPIRIVNSRFRVLSGNRYEIIDRVGKDSNLYVPDNFNNTLNLILTSNKIPNIVFKNTSNGGILTGGKYIYYFLYSTADGNLTDIMGESFDVVVLKDNGTVATTIGSNTATTKKVNFSIKNIDTAFAYLKVYYSYSSGLEEGTTTYYEIINKYPIINDEIDFSHTGYETINQITKDELNLTYSTIVTAKSMTQIKGRLMLANIKNNSFDSDVFAAHARSIESYFDTATLDTVGLYSSDINEIYNVSIAQGSSDSPTIYDGWVGGYYNPKNIYYRTGHFGGEGYMYGIVYILPNGTTSPVYPIRGMDAYNPYLETALDPTLDYTEYASNPEVVGSYGWNDSNTKLENNNGYFRFPLRNEDNETELYNNAGHATILKLNVQIPNIPQEILDQSIGFFIVRSERKKDCVAQGIVIPTIRSVVGKTDYFPLGYPADEYIEFNSGNYSSMKVLPIVKGYIEGVAAALGGGVPDGSTNYLHPLRINRVYNNNTSDFIYDSARYGFISPDTVADPEKYSQIFKSSSLTLVGVQRVSGIQEYLTSNSTYDPSISQLSLFKQTYDDRVDDYDSMYSHPFSRDTSTYYGRREVLGNWVIGNADYVNEEHFGAFEKYAYVYTPGDDKNLWLSYNNYVGLTLTEVENDWSFINDADIREFIVKTSEESDTSEAGEIVDDATIHDFSGNFGVLINIYESNDNAGPRFAKYLRSVDNIKLLHDPRNETYFPVSERYYWNDDVRDSVGASNDAKYLDNTQSLDVYRGDCYVNITYRQIYKNISESDITEVGTETNANVGIGYAISFISESNYNIALRQNELFDVTEPRERTFSPYQGSSSSGSSAEKFAIFKQQEYKNLPESKNYNFAYVQNKEDSRNYLLYDESVPYIQTRFNTRIAYSNIQVNSSFENSYRKFDLINYVDYTKQYGEIVKIESYNNDLLCVFENAIINIPVEQRIQVGADTAGSIYTESGGVITQYYGIISDVYGSRWADSIKKTNGIVYGVDIDRGKIWRFANRFELISDFTIQSWLKEFNNSYKSYKPNKYFINISTYYDQGNGDVIFTFYNKINSDNLNTDLGELEINHPIFSDYNYITVAESDFWKFRLGMKIYVNGGNSAGLHTVTDLIAPDTIEIDHITEYGEDYTYTTNVRIYDRYDTMIYSEPLQLFKSEASYHPMHIITMRDEFYSYPIEYYKNSYSLWQHRVEPTDDNGKELYYNYYGDQYTQEFEYIVNEAIDYQKIYDNIVAVCNNVYPYSIIFTNDNDNVEQLIEPRVENNILFANASYDENHLYIVIDKFENKRIRDKYCKIKFIYNSGDKLVLQLIDTIFRVSFS